MKESEASEQWCPFYRVAMGATGLDIIDNRESGSNCLGSRCMAWRETVPEHGYCGLAGVPPEGGADDIVWPSDSRD